MISELELNGFAIHRDFFGEKMLIRLRKEAAKLAEESGTACVRGLRQRSRTFDELANCSEVSDLLPAEYEPVRSILFDKTPTENWPVLWHRDLTIAVTRRFEIEGFGPWSVKNGVPHVQPPLSLLENMVTARIHLDDAGAGNGALRVVPGSHHSDTLDHEDSAVTSECLAGDVLLMKPLIWHSSRRSTVPGHRRVVHVEFARPGDLDSRLEWYESAEPL